MSLERPRVALIQFPGSNCEWETKRSAEAAGLDCDVFRWNLDPELLAGYDGYIIGGGFSYQDRVRSGAIAAKEPIVGRVFDEVTRHGKPCIGICNGAQVLVEAGMVPGVEWGAVQMALAPNFHDPRGRISGFCCRWVRLKHSSSSCKLTSRMAPGQVWPVPISHGEGRFSTRQEGLLETLRERDQIVFQYCDVQGNEDDSREVNPNGALAGIAGLCNPEGNVLAVMPHPERASFLRQIPGELDPEWLRAKREAQGSADAMSAPAPGLDVFGSMRDFLAGV